ncbi:MAG: hypothetical protein AAF799_39710 [Myxococcota bacterium]
MIALRPCLGIGILVTMAVACDGAKKDPAPNADAKTKAAPKADADEADGDAKADDKAPDEKKAEAKPAVHLEAGSPVANPDGAPPAFGPGGAEGPTGVHPRLSVLPTPDLAVVINDRGVVALDATGKEVGLLTSTKPEWCRVDPRANVLWMLGGDIRTLSMLDLQSDEPAVELLESAPDTVVIKYPDEQLGQPEGHTYREGVVVNMSDPPRLESTVGCEGDMSWYCFEGEDNDEKARKRLIADLNKELAGTKLPVEAMSKIIARSVGGKATIPDPGRTPTPTKVSIPTDGCKEAPDACGEASPLPGTRFWKVVVANDRGDFYHEDFQLFDPLAKEFFDPADPKGRSKGPLALDREGAFVPEVVAPSGTLALSYDSLVQLSGGVVAKGLAGNCGFWGGGWEL